MYKIERNSIIENVKRMLLESVKTYWEEKTWIKDCWIIH